MTVLHGLAWLPGPVLGILLLIALLQGSRLARRRGAASDALRLPVIVSLLLPTRQRFF